MEQLLTYMAAQPEDAAILTATAKASKRHWGYPEELMKLWQPDLTINEAYILRNRVVKVYNCSGFIGFYALVDQGNGSWEIDHLWLVPHSLRKGLGRQVFQHIILTLRKAGASKVCLVAEPKAKGFYEKMGAEIIGQIASKVPGRLLDICEIVITPEVQ